MALLISTRRAWLEHLAHLRSKAAVRIYFTGSVTVGMSVAVRDHTSTPQAFYVPWGHRFGTNLQISKEEIIAWFEQVKPIFFDYSQETMLMNSALGTTVAWGDSLVLFPDAHMDFGYEVHKRLGVNFRSLALIGEDNDLADFSTEDDLFVERAGREAALLLVLSEELLGKGKDVKRLVEYESRRDLATRMLPLGFHGLPVHPSLRSDIESLQGRISEVERAIEEHLGPRSGWVHHQALAGRLFTLDDGLRLKPKVFTEKTERPSTSREALEAIFNQHPVIERLIQRSSLVERHKNLTALQQSIYLGRVQFRWMRDQFLPVAMNYYGQRLGLSDELRYFACPEGMRWWSLQAGHFVLKRVASLSSEKLSEEISVRHVLNEADPDPYESSLQALMGSRGARPIFSSYPEVASFQAMMAPQVLDEIWDKVKVYESQCRKALLLALSTIKAPPPFLLPYRDRVVFPVASEFTVDPDMKIVIEGILGTTVKLLSEPVP